MSSSEPTPTPVEQSQTSGMGVGLWIVVAIVAAIVIAVSAYYIQLRVRERAVYDKIMAEKREEKLRTEQFMTQDEFNASMVQRVAQIQPYTQYQMQAEVAESNMAPWVTRNQSSAKYSNNYYRLPDERPQRDFATLSPQEQQEIIRYQGQTSWKNLGAQVSAAIKQELNFH